MKKIALLFVPLLFSLGCSKGLATPAATPSYVTISPQTAAVTCDVNGCTPQTVEFTATVYASDGTTLMPNATVSFSDDVNDGFSHPNFTKVSQGQSETLTFLADSPAGTVYPTAIITTYGGTLVKSQATITVTQQ